MSVLVLDFGSQVTQLIARRVREAGVYCEIVPFNKADEALARKPRAIILSGGPASVYAQDAPRAPQAVFEAGVPVLGICYGEMTMSVQLGGAVEGSHDQELGRADIHVCKASP
jgi:GMP synthase (glutamine-hydrolysing)